MLVMGTNVEDKTSQQQLQLEGIVCFYLPPYKSLKALTDLNKDIYHPKCSAVLFKIRNVCFYGSGLIPQLYNYRGTFQSVQISVFTEHSGEAMAS